MGEYTSKGQGALNTVLGAIGTAGATGILNGGGCDNGGILNLGGNRNNNCYVNEKEFHWAQIANSKDAELAKEKAERYADGVGLSVYEQLVKERKEVDAAQNEGFRYLNEKISTLESDNAVLRSDIRCLSVTNQQEHAALKNSCESAIALEGERRLNGDQNLKCYVDATFVPGNLVMPLDSICPEAMPKCPDVQLVELVSSAASQAVAAAMGATSARAVAK